MVRFLVIVLLSAGAWFLGRYYAYEPLAKVFFQEEDEHFEREVIVNTNTGQIKRMIDLQKIRPEELALHFALKEPKPWPPETKEGEETLLLEAGSPIRVLAVDGKNLRVEPLGREGEAGVVSVDETNFLEAITRERFAQFAAGAGGLGDSSFGRRLQEGEDISDAFAVLDMVSPSQKKDLRSEPEKKVQKILKKEPEDSVANADEPLSEPEMINLMKEYLEEEGLLSFEAGAVKTWETGEEEVNGKTYQAGYASYHGETVFGIQDAKAIALFEDGKLVQWLNPITGTVLD